MRHLEPTHDERQLTQRRVALECALQHIATRSTHTTVVVVTIVVVVVFVVVEQVAVVVVARGARTLLGMVASIRKQPCDDDEEAHSVSSSNQTISTHTHTHTHTHWLSR